jgi:hypothetical protein
MSQEICEKQKRREELFGGFPKRELPKDKIFIGNCSSLEKRINEADFDDLFTKEELVRVHEILRGVWKTRHLTPSEVVELADKGIHLGSYHFDKPLCSLKS